MDWKNYQVDPGKGVFEKIVRRMRLRRVLKIGGVLAAVAVIVAGVIIVSSPKEKRQIANAVVQQTAVRVSTEKISDDNTAMVTEPQKQHHEQAEVVAPIASVVTAEETPVQLNSAATPVTVTTPQSSSTIDVSSSSMQESVAVATVAESVAATNNGIVEPVASNTDNADAATPEPQTVVTNAPKSDPPQPEPYHEDDVIWVPNIIFPGGDVEDNRDFRIKATSDLSNFHVYIYNRGGRQLFSSTDPQFVWNATVNGTPVPQGAYVWVVSYRDSNGLPCQRTGTVTVVR